jgi:hypothetical protein
MDEKALNTILLLYYTLTIAPSQLFGMSFSFYEGQNGMHKLLTKIRHKKNTHKK